MNHELQAFAMIYEPSTMNYKLLLWSMNHQPWTKLISLSLQPQNVLSLPACLAEESPGNTEHPAS